MIIDKIGIFILFLGPLVFFHELGHFLFARFFKVKVEVFSIGFGPKIFKKIRGGTEYALSIIPLGGYVKMYGDDPLAKDEVPEEMRQFSFSHKKKWPRFWIVVGGPLANLILAFVIYFGLILSGEQVPEIKLGMVPENSVFFEQGLRGGDVITKYNGKQIFNLADLGMEDKNLIKVLTIKRKNEEKEIIFGMKGKDFFENLLKYPPILRRPILISKEGKSYILSSSAQNFDWEDSLEVMSGDFGQRPYYLFDYSEKVVAPEYKGEKKPVKEIFLKFNGPNEFFTALERNGFLPVDLVIKSLKMNSAADLAHLKAGDIIIKLNGESLFSFDELRKKLQDTKTEQVELAYYRDGKALTVKVTPLISTEEGQKRKVIGVYTSGELLPLQFMTLPSPGFFNSIAIAFDRTIEGIVKTVLGFKKLIFGEVALSNIGGPLAIGKVASDSFNASITLFLQLMAFISINLGIINLLPIPILDGGHIMFIFLEILNRGPVSRKKMEMAQQVGLSILLILMVGAIFNDFSRFF